MITFDNNKLRDKNFKQQFDSKLAEIKQVQEKNNYLSYVANRKLFDELFDIYKINLKDYEIHFETNYNNYVTIKQYLFQNENDMHRARLKTCQIQLLKIESDLNVNDYKVNSKSKIQIIALYKAIDYYVTEFKNLKTNLQNMEQTIEKSKPHVWLEKFENLQEKYELAKKEVYGDTIPKEKIEINQLELRDLYVQKSLSINSFSSVIQSNEKYLRILENYKNKPVYFKDFEKFYTETKQALSKRKKKKKIYLLLISIFIVIFSFAAIKINDFFVLYKENSTWSKAKKMNTIESYDEYLSIYPNGLYRSDAINLSDELLWNFAKTSNNTDDFYKYQEKFPNGIHISEVNNLLIDKDWSKALEINTLEIYSEFSSKYPDSKYKNLIKEKFNYFIPSKEILVNLVTSYIKDNYNNYSIYDSKIEISSKQRDYSSKYSFVVDCRFIHLPGEEPEFFRFRIDKQNTKWRIIKGSKINKQGQVID